MESEKERWRVRDRKGWFAVVVVVVVVMGRGGGDDGLQTEGWEVRLRERTKEEGT